ncbi:MAG TPA: hypothetical protein VIX59_00685, partial [Candidatus Binataceae bacterium]
MKRSLDARRFAPARRRRRDAFASAALLSIAIALTIAVAGCSRAEKSPPPKPQNLEELKSALAAILARYHIPGVGVALVTRDKVIWAGGVGKAAL